MSLSSVRKLKRRTESEWGGGREQRVTTLLLFLVEDQDLTSCEDRLELGPACSGRHFKVRVLRLPTFTLRLLFQSDDPDGTHPPRT